MVYPANASISVSVLADNGEVLRQQRAQLTSIALGIVEEVFTGCSEFAEGLVIAIVEHLLLEELP
jgi:hypothetical protein